jgi:hypothetical protein
MLKVYKKSREGNRPEPSSGVRILYARFECVGYIAGESGKANPA